MQNIFLRILISKIPLTKKINFHHFDYYQKDFQRLQLFSILRLKIYITIHKSYTVQIIPYWKTHTMNRLFMYFKVTLPCDCEITMVTRMAFVIIFSMLFFSYNCENLKLNKFTSLIQSIKFKLTLNFKSGK